MQRLCFQKHIVECSLYFQRSHENFDFIKNYRLDIKCKIKIRFM